MTAFVIKAKRAAISHDAANGAKENSPKRVKKTAAGQKGWDVLRVSDMKYRSYEVGMRRTDATLNKVAAFFASIRFAATANSGVCRESACTQAAVKRPSFEQALNPRADSG